MPVLSSAVSALSTFYQDSLNPQVEDERRAVDRPAAGQAADDRRLRLQEVASGSRTSTPTTRSSLVENFLRMTFGFPAEPYEVDPAVAKALDTAVHPARRPRAELLDLDRPPGRVVAGQPVRLGLGRHPRAVRPAARRRQPGGAGDAAERIRADRRRRRRVREEGEEQGGRRQAHGLRAPGLQELRPARGHRQAVRRRGALGHGQARRPARHRHGTRGPTRSRTTTSSSASSTRTSTSTPG